MHRTRITRERYLLRRDRLHLVLNLLEALPEHYKLSIEFENEKGMRSGKFKENEEPKIAYLPSKNQENKHTFLFEDAFNEMIQDMQKVNPEVKNEKHKRIPKDWTLYYLRQKALKEKISLEEFAWVLLSYNQKRGTDLIEIANENEKSDEIKEFLDLKVISVDEKEDKKGCYFEITLNDSENTKYKEYSTEQLTFVDDIKEVTRISKLDDKGDIIKNKTILKITDLYKLELCKVEKEETDIKKKFKYYFHYKNGWVSSKDSEKGNYGYDKIQKELEENKQGRNELFIVSAEYDAQGNPLKEFPSIKLPDFNSEGSRDWTLLKKKSEKEAIKFNISVGYANTDGSSKHYISPKIYDILKNDVKTGKQTKIIGGIFQTIDRKFYREELTDIINTQRKYHTETLDNKAVFEKCVKLLYPHNHSHSKMLMDNKTQITNLLVNDIVFYQRPLSSKKSEITDCKYEVDYWKEIVDKTTGEIKEIPIYKKAVSVSHPLFQEFRIWDKIHNIKLIQLEKKNNSEKTETNIDVTNQYFTEEVYQKLFDYFNNRTSVTMDNFLTFCSNELNIKIGKSDDRKFVWNYPEEEEFKGNETRKGFEIRFKRCGFTDFNQFMTQQKEMELWHYLYSVSIEERKKKSQSPEKKGKTSIQNFFTKYFKDFEVKKEVFDKLCADFENYPKFDSKYSSYSEKALKKILSLMRVGDNFITDQQNNSLKNKYVERIETILGKFNEIDWKQKIVNFDSVVVNEVNLKKGELPLPKGLFSTFKNFKTLEDFKFLNLTEASYLLYGRHSELAHIKYWDSPQKIREGILEELKQHSLNNPTAENVIKEMMKLVADIWEHYGKGKENFFDEIHLEVARDLQKSNKEKKKIGDAQKNNRKQNNRLRNILKDFLQNSEYKANATNQDHFERLKIVEEGTKEVAQKDEEIEAILKKQSITKQEFEKYKLWIEQGYKSPYTGAFIKLSDLFNGDKYNIDHIFPRALVTNDSLNNKVVCEASVNRFKSDKTGREFIIQYGGKKHRIYDEELNREVEFTILSELEYETLVKKQFKGAKKYILLCNEVPSGFTNSQLNTTKHIARKAMELLSHIVREKGEVEFRAKRVLPISGKITSMLKSEWKFNEIWVELLRERFERLNNLHQTTDFGSEKIAKSGHPYFEIGTEFIKGKNNNFELKRLDHRHHALDALIVALCTENHIQYINNINSGITNNSKEKIFAIKKQREAIKRLIQYSQPKKENPKKKEWKFMLPGSYREKNTIENGKETVVDLYWESGVSEKSKDYKKAILESLQQCIVSFKNDFKVVSKTFNLYESFYDDKGNLRLDDKGNPKKALVKQKNENKKLWAIRKPLHEDTSFGEVNLKKIKTVRFKEAFDNPQVIVNKEFKNKIIELQQLNFDIKKIKKYFKDNKDIWKDFNFNKIEIYYFTKNNLNPITKEPKERYFATRKELWAIFKDDKGKFKDFNKSIDIIENITDTGIQKILIKYLESKNNNLEVAFSPEGIEEMNKNIQSYNNNIPHKPIHKVRIYEKGEKRFQLGNGKGSKHKYVQTAKGTNLFFAIYNDEGNRSYETIPLNIVIERQKQGMPSCPDMNEKGNRLLFSLSPNDLVYVPTEEEQEHPHLVDFNKLNKEQIKRVYKFVSCTGGEGHFVPNVNAFEIVKNENGTNSKSERIQNFYDQNTVFETNNKGEKLPIIIKSVCWKLEIDRLGNIVKAIKR